MSVRYHNSIELARDPESVDKHAAVAAVGKRGEAACFRETPFALGQLDLSQMELHLNVVHLRVCGHLCNARVSRLYDRNLRQRSVYLDQDLPHSVGQLVVEDLSDLRASQVRCLILLVEN